MQTYLWIMIGGGLGAVLRFWLSDFTARHLGEQFPWGTLLVNISGCFLIGFFAAFTDPQGKWMVAPAGRIFFMAGICGGYTTFSAFSLQTLKMIQEGAVLPAAANASLSVFLCLFAVWAGDAGGKFLRG